MSIEYHYPSFTTHGPPSYPRVCQMMVPPPMIGPQPVIVTVDVECVFRKKDDDTTRGKVKFEYKMRLGNDIISASWKELQRTLRDIEGVKHRIHELKEDYDIVALTPS